MSRKLVRGPTVVKQQSKRCSVCDVSFSFAITHHNCRLCGASVCGRCSPMKIHVGRSEPKRVCNPCYASKKSGGAETRTEYQRPPEQMVYQQPPQQPPPQVYGAYQQPPQSLQQQQQQQPLGYGGYPQPSGYGLYQQPPQQPPPQLSQLQPGAYQQPPQQPPPQLSQLQPGAYQQPPQQPPPQLSQAQPLDYAAYQQPPQQPPPQVPQSLLVSMCGVCQVNVIRLGTAVECYHCKKECCSSCASMTVQVPDRPVPVRVCMTCFGSLSRAPPQPMARRNTGGSQPFQQERPPSVARADTVSGGSHRQKPLPIPAARQGTQPPPAALEKRNTLGPRAPVGSLNAYDDPPLTGVAVGNAYDARPPAAGGANVYDQPPSSGPYQDAYSLLPAADYFVPPSLVPPVQPTNPHGSQLGNQTFPETPEMKRQRSEFARRQEEMRRKLEAALAQDPAFQSSSNRPPPK